MIKFKKTHPDTKMPTRAYPGDAGYDIYSVENIDLPPSIITHDYFRPSDVHNLTTCRLMVPVGLSLEIPQGYYITIETRSSLGLKGVQCHNGIIDSTYIGDISPILLNHSSEIIHIKKGEKIAQLVIHKTVDEEFVEVTELTSTGRGEKGFGSSGK